MKPKTAIGKLSSYREEYGRLLKIGAPVFVTQLGIIVVSFADTMMVGAYGTAELAAAAFVNSVFLVVFVMLIGLANGITPMVGALFGSGDSHGVGRIFRASLQVDILVGVVFTAIMAALYPFLDRMGQDPDLLPLIRPYYLIILAGLVPGAIFCCCQQTANGTTDTAMPMWVMISANVLNILGNWILIFGNFGAPELGLNGAGISTIVSRYLASAAILLWILFHRRYAPYRAGMHDRAAAGHLRREVWLTSYPPMIQGGAECALWSFGAVVSGWFGKVQLAAYQVVNTASQLGFTTYLSFAIATSIRVANLNGVRDWRGMRRTASAGLHLNLMLCAAASLVFIFLPGPLIRLFTPDPEVIECALPLILPMVLYQVCDAMQVTYANAQRGTKVVRPLLWVAVLSYCCVGMPLSVLFGSGFGWRNVGVYYSFVVALAVAAVLFLWSFKRTVRRLEKADREFVKPS